MLLLFVNLCGLFPWQTEKWDEDREEGTFAGIK